MAETQYRTVNPATGELVKTFEFHTDEQIAEALDAVQQTYESWSVTPLAERVAVVRRIAELMDERSEQIGATITEEMGKSLPEAIGEAEFSSRIFAYYADNAEKLLAEEPLTDFTGQEAVVQKLPVGPLLGVMPWNYPFYQVARFAAPNLVLGNTMVLKHAKINPQCAQLIEDILLEAGLPEGAYKNLFCTHGQIAQIIADPRIQGVSLTGSERAGETIGEQAGRHLKKCVLELGGSDPYIVLSTEDPRQAARDALATRLQNWGQACNSNKRMIVMADIYDEFVDELVKATSELKAADPASGEKNVYGPLSSEDAADELAAQVAAAREDGANVRIGGERVGGPHGGGFYVSPAVITDVTPEHRVYREELFGLVSVVYKVNSADEAVALANDSEFGLGSAVFSTDVAEAKQVADRLHVGMAHVNVNKVMAAPVPFGGVKRSGFGRELGPLGIDEFANRRVFVVADKA
ncbi:NAD-dependent succinate-semialdehyde dehydrogenase [Micrococcus sp.]|uniref:NAD-dependent succinate-semialdehyde dehydrogenase n=1 Tax=Micrococcus sp. TaxID=1271 RepID=UPI002A911533|nr:NAD-dependent succinate-semialdehyde dehydrogenase [Micrococcus sp.]MDY6055635.1 NAD-dependent succinate-semialdehyde dehydrogenase [Micrococcus sp.]